MDSTRRVFLRRLTQLGIAVLGLLSPLRLGAQRQTQWRIRGARASDIADLAVIFNAHLTAGMCPDADQIEPWTPETAGKFLAIYTGTLILDRDGVPVGFGGLIDYSDPSTTSSIIAGAEPEIKVVALRPDLLPPPAMLAAAERLAAAMARELVRMGFSGCQMRIAAWPLFSANEWYTRHMTVRMVRKRDGVDHALDVSFDLAGMLTTLAREGLEP
jgi:hypothetical protein